MRERCPRLVDDIVRPGQTISSIRFERRAGGKGANQAAAVARAGGAVSLVGAVGEDGAWLIRVLQDYGVSAANVSIVQVYSRRNNLCIDSYMLSSSS
jgi:ribokinase